MRRKAARKRAVRYGLVAANALILGIATAFILHTSNSTKLSSSAALKSASVAGVQANPLDQVSSADIALTVARMSSLPESTAINSQAESQAVDMSRAVATDTVVSKPQIVSTQLKSKADIQTYTTVAGDTVSALAQKFGVTSDSIRWSNSLSGDSLTVGTKLTIPPVNGIVYTVQAGDTVDSLASKYNASKDKIIAFNDAEISGLKPGSQIVIPDGTKAVPVTAAQIARGSSGATGFPWGGSPIYGYNGYDYGYCTWYVANRLPVPSNWGNANTWDNLAPRSGWTVSSVPKAGAIGEIDSGYYGHVAYVEAVSDDGTMIKYSDMNGLAGFGRVGYSGWVPASKFPHYIYR
jgi:surface antigen